MGCYRWLYYRGVDIFGRWPVCVNVSDGQWLRRFVFLLPRVILLWNLVSGTGFALTLVWVSNAVPRPPTKRAAAIGIVNGFGNLGNLLAYHHITAEFMPRANISYLIELGHMRGKLHGVRSTISQ